MALLSSFIRLAVFLVDHFWRQNEILTSNFALTLNFKEPEGTLLTVLPAVFERLEKQ